MNSFTNSDAWIMLALLFNQQPDGASLRDLIAAADYINHAIVTYEELSGGLARLIRAGYVEKQAGHFRATATIRSFYAQTARPRRALNADWKAVEHFLQTTEVIVTTAHVTPSRIVSRAAYDHAVHAYLATN